ncbi:MAG: bifunctional phosphoribosyl-AMP cyclohydrolase/phosphoribosyl-ATP diphosphatase HisIE [Clostridiales bacterium]|jgi:phosphoribosyl-ATP pyrophosphohydrolase/phosphoribosyl-AMP cyclohydrolase|nr:bifunctional phosphoribosyl-AMP cyclohydrolase/phosphoribosyl-ATP diphosphatase HisIE [Clostridiales bacterium]
MEIFTEKIKYNPDGLVPCIAQDHKTKEVLMLAYMNEEALKTTIETGYMTYYSRSRNALWKKGETSGNIQKLVTLKHDCDGDTLLAQVEQTGPACHTGNRTCFYAPGIGEDDSFSQVLEEDYKTILDRKKHPSEGSYTNYLFDKGIDTICKKLGEECTEIVIAVKNDNKSEILYETGDFLYHLMVMMAEKDIVWDEIYKELISRR